MDMDSIDVMDSMDSMDKKDIYDGLCCVIYLFTTEISEIYEKD